MKFMLLCSLFKDPELPCSPASAGDFLLESATTFQSAFPARSGYSLQGGIGQWPRSRLNAQNEDILSFSVREYCPLVCNSKNSIRLQIVA